MSNPTRKRPPIPTDVKAKLWLRSGGRCQFKGCNDPLWHDNLTYTEMNTSYIAHIYGYAPLSARYDRVLSPRLEKDFSNLMLMCDKHHRLIDDKKTSIQYSAEYLIAMKKNHEKRIELLTSISPDKKSMIILFGAKIGDHDSPLKMNTVQQAIMPEYFPHSAHPIELGLSNASFKDSESNYWEIQAENLCGQFSQKLEATRLKQEIQHYSIFGMAPIPLLIKLGTLLNDIYPAEVYQLHREPSSWKWQSEAPIIKHSISEPKGKSKNVVLKLGLSAAISDARITNVLGTDCEIWSISHENPNNNYMRHKSSLEDFRFTMRKAFSMIKNRHDQNSSIHIFPAMPVSAAIELGRVWMPKADLPMHIYDQNPHQDGFYKTLFIN